ncbi:hypothetical protein JOF35_005232 [Streptomyces demainii]|uniref:Uncharacterized protein n=1 Tax=Streptomyces demainii TaxID=588122 RepID=A0ABT9KWZ5_9ACTN|nr:hypothetical protein [Streptomyces demainii]
MSLRVSSTRSSTSAPAARRPHRRCRTPPRPVVPRPARHGRGPADEATGYRGWPACQRRRCPRTTPGARGGRARRGRPTALDAGAPSAAHGAGGTAPPCTLCSSPDTSPRWPADRAGTDCGGQPAERPYPPGPGRGRRHVRRDVCLRTRTSEDTTLAELIEQIDARAGRPSATMRSPSTGWPTASSPGGEPARNPLFDAFSPCRTSTSGVPQGRARDLPRAAQPRNHPLRPQPSGVTRGPTAWRCTWSTRRPVRCRVRGASARSVRAGPGRHRDRRRPALGTARLASKATVRCPDLTSEGLPMTTSFSFHQAMHSFPDQADF